MITLRCAFGHQYEVPDRVLQDIIDEPAIVAYITHDREMYASPKHGGLIVECGEVIVWQRHTGPKPTRRFKFRKDRQLDLF